MAYFNNRKEQTINTLNSFKELYYPLDKPYYNFEVIIVDDNCNDEFKLHNILNNYPFIIKYIEISKEEKGIRKNPCLAYNKGFENASGDVIIIQNPECMHVGDIILFLVNNLKENDYFSFSCFSTNNYDINNELVKSNNKFEKINNNDFLNRNTHGINWYNHPIYRPVSYHFCTAIYKEKLNSLGGFDPAYSEGYCYDDDEFLFRIKYYLKLNVLNIPPDNVFVIHQYHTLNTSTNTDINDLNNPISILLNKNKKLFEELQKKYN
jgi:hypothetical protein